MSDELLCPNGHSGPWIVIEMMSYWRPVESATTDEGRVELSEQNPAIVLEHNEGKPRRLICMADVDGGECEQEVPVTYKMRVTYI